MSNKKLQINKPLDSEARLETINNLMGAWSRGVYEFTTVEDQLTLAMTTLLAVRSVANTGATGTDAILVGCSELQELQDYIEAESHCVSSGVVN